LAIQGIDDAQKLREHFEMTLRPELEQIAHEVCSVTDRQTYSFHEMNLGRVEQCGEAVAGTQILHVEIPILVHHKTKMTLMAPQKGM
jgi:hypothetical protein